jgi:hypothetical protein
MSMARAVIIIDRARPRPGLAESARKAASHVGSLGWRLDRTSRNPAFAACECKEIRGASGVAV